MKAEFNPEDFMEALDAFAERHGYGLDSAFRLQSMFLRDLGTTSHNQLAKRLDASPAWKELCFSSVKNSPEIKPGTITARSLKDITDQLALPMTFKEVSTWALFNALQSGASAFAQSELTAYQQESILNGSLFGQIRGMSQTWSREISPLLRNKLCAAYFSKIDLQIKQREQVTGGDTAVFIESKNGNGRLETIPLILQAKRFAREDAKISQRNGEIYQFHTLRDYWLPTAYIFFHNSRSGIARPLPPLVKDVHDIIYSETPEKTSALTDSLPLANYVLRLIATAPNKHRYLSPADAVAAMAANVSPRDLINVIVISPSSDAELRFDEAWRSYLVEHGYIVEPEPEPDPDPSDDFGI
ncbi:hypothetical protein [Sinorhizobium fredii]|uniref:hypothetical protein n=1 Tax=Rhizobium fredii TaxID=380 RepID=UPI0035172BF5